MGDFFIFLYKSERMPLQMTTLMQSVVQIVCDLEPTIPCLRDRMTVRALRMLLENSMLEMCGCERSVLIFAEMSRIIRSMALANPGSSSARLCCVVNDAMRGLSIADFLNRPSTDVDTLRFFIGFYKNICDGLGGLLDDEDFMHTMGCQGNAKFSEIISVIRTTISNEENRVQPLP